MRPLLIAALQDGSPAVPADVPREPTGTGSMWVPLLLVGLVFWFLLIAPERKNRKKREAMLGALKKGDRVMTASGMYGTVAALSESDVTLQVADGVRIRFSRQAIQTVVDEKAEAGAS